MSCPYVTSGCNYPEGDCSGECHKPENKCRFCSFNVGQAEERCASLEQAEGCDAFEIKVVLKKAAAAHFTAKGVDC